MFNSPMLLDFNSNNNNNNSSNNQKRSKITKACDNCRRRRVKCDGVPEGCGGCKAAKTQCVYTTSNTKRGPPKGYVEVIEDRLGKIENMLAGIVRKKKVSTSASTSSSSRNKANATSDPNHGSVAPGANSDNEDGQGDDDDDRMSTHSSVLVEVKQQPPASPALYPARSSTPSARNIRSGSATVSSLGRHGPLVSRNHSLTTLLPFSQQDGPESVSQAEMAALTNMFDKLGTTSVRTTVPFPWLTPEQSQQYGRNHLQFTLQSLEPPLPMLDRPFPSTLSSDQTLQLLDNFFQRFNTFLPIIHRPTFMKQYLLQQCSLCPPSALSSSVSKVHQATPQEIEAHKQHLEDPVAPISPLLFSALLAVASKVPSTGSKMTAEERQRSGTISQTYFDNARLLLDEFMDVPRVSTVQALCLMSQFHHQGQWKATRSSSYLSMAIRMAHELGLHRDPEALVQGPEADGLRCLWWSMFILDHQFSAWLGLGLMMHGKESDVELPVDPTSSQQNLRGFICMVRLVKILGSVLQHSYSTQSLPPQFGGHDSMVSYIEASLTSWLSNLAPEMRWQNAANVVKRGSPALPMRSPPPSIHSTLAETARALSLAKEAGEIYPAYLYIVYNTTLILLHRPYIVGAAGSPAAAQSNTICTGSGRAITDIAQGLDMEHCSYVVNRFTLYALLQAGVIHAMNAVYDKRGSQVAMDYYNRTLGILGSFLNCSSYSGGVSEGINVLEQFLATTMKAAADQENSSLDNETQDVYQQENQHYRKKRQLEGPAMTLQHSAAAVQYTPSPLASGSALSYMPSNVLQPMMAPTTLSMMNSSSLPDAIGNDAAHASQYNYFQSSQSQQQTPIDLKEQQKQQQLKIQQQHRLYQQMQAFGPSTVNKLADTKGDTLLEQQQQQQQQLMRQQLQRQQQRQQLEMEMKEQEANPSLYHQQHQPTLTTMSAPVIPSHRHAMQLLQQQRQQQGHGHMPMTMTGLNQEPMSMGTMGSMMSNEFEYDTTKFWVDFSDSNNGTLNPAQLQQDPMSSATVSRAGGADTQFSGPLWT
ncbi:hypothetical protein BG011_005014 [Mortierella polycephala]|uniref:Zn(2)-C6 fungal-type domain-containing protein n=1 Tax=Mortierella polycephala TaxID=41804 RepID=A0A9P6QFU2_9FUNG|nr:hypothetical protein BG011_005014 [Mortierella polycephala]